ncbi:MAG: hypothetical protein ABWX84_15415 [Nocardioides sp.]
MATSRARLPGWARWPVTLTAALLTMAVTYSCAFAFAAQCPGFRGAGIVAAPDSDQARLCGQDGGLGVAIIWAATLALGALLIWVCLRASRVVVLLGAALLCLVVPLATLGVVLLPDDDCSAAQQEAGGDCERDAEA